VLSKGQRLFTRHFILYVRKSAKGVPRLGVTVSKKVGNAAVRNRIKRCVREAFRTHPLWFDEPVDLVVIAKTPGRPAKGQPAHDKLRVRDVSYHVAVDEIGGALRRARRAPAPSRKVEHRR
jgi:ribonuclease P protein component